MSSTATEAVRRLIEIVWTEGRADVAAEVVHDEYGLELKAFAGVSGADAVLREKQAFDEEFEGARFVVQHTLTHGETVVALWEATGASKKETFTSRNGRVLPKPLHVNGVSVHRLQDGRVRSTDRYWPVQPSRILS